MPKYNRGGKTMKAQDVGRMSVLRQHFLMPGERLQPSVTGNVRLAGLRQQTSVYLNARIECFATPIRWLWDQWPDYVKQGPTGVLTPPTMSGSAWTGAPARNHTQHLGVGMPMTAFFKPFAQAPILIFNRWFKWKEDADIDYDNPPTTFYGGDDKLVNLPSAASRLHDESAFNDGEYRVPSATVLDIRDLAQYQARFNQAALAEWNAEERYNVFMQEIFNAQGNDEVDKVPTRLRSGAELGVTPRDMYATDGPSLGEIMSINNFSVNHRWDDFIAKEHCIITYVMAIRFLPIMEDGVMPGLYPAETTYPVYQGDPHLIAAERPVDVSIRELDGTDSGTTIGYLPAAWQLREGYDHIDNKIASLGNFPLMDNQPTTAAGYRDATRINDAFRSSALGDWFADLDFKCNVVSQIPEAGHSIVTGGTRNRMPDGKLHPTGGYLV